MDVSTMAHRWCNRDFGKKNGFRNAHFSCDDTYFYSYSTAIAMWIDKTPGNLLMAIIDKNLTSTTSRHRYAVISAVPKDVKVIYVSQRGCSRRDYDNVDFCKINWKISIPNRLAESIQRLLSEFFLSDSISTEDNYRLAQSYIDDLNWLLDNRSEVKEVENFLNIDERLLSGVRNRMSAKELIDYLHGKGAIAAYEARTLPQRRARRTRNFVKWFNDHHGTSLTYKEIKKLSAKDSVLLACYDRSFDIKPRNSLDYVKKEKIRNYILGEDSHSNSDVIVNHFTGERYKYQGLYSFLYRHINPKNTEDFLYSHDFHHLCGRPTLDVDAYLRSPDKRKFMERFYQVCKITSLNQESAFIWHNITKNGGIESCTDRELEAYNKIQAKYIRYIEKKEKEDERREKERIRMEEERKKLEKMREEKYQYYCSRGIEGYRAMYYEGMCGVSVGSSFGSDYFFGGNVLLRWKSDKIIETSKNIYLTVEQAKKIWKKVCKWHEAPWSFESEKLETKSGAYSTKTIS